MAPSNLAEYFAGGPSTSQHVVAKDNEDFLNSSYQLKRTRSVGILDDYISASQKLSSEDLVPDCAIDKINNASHFSSTNLADYAEQASPAPSNTSTTSDNSVMTQFSLTGQDGPELTEVEETSAMQHSQQQQQQHQQQKGHVKQHPTPSNTNHIPPSQISPDGRMLALHDDTEMVYEPTGHVDYLSHNWKESDISKSWRYVILRRKDVANSARLENASWRTWAQARNNLKTFPPQELNWSKESDVTWLYGPLYKEHHISDALLEDRSSRQDTLQPLSKSRPVSQQTADISSASGSASPCIDPHLKPILKKKSNVEKMISDASYARLQTLFDDHDTKARPKGSPILESGSHLSSTEYSPLPTIASKDHSRSSSPFSLNTDNKPIEDTNTTTPNIANTNKSVLSDNNSTQEPPKERRIHFNMRVEQCQVRPGYGDHDVVHSDDYYDDDYDYDDDEYYDEDTTNTHYDDEDEDDEDDGMEIAVVPQRRVESGLGSASPAVSAVSSNSEAKALKTIVFLPSTTLKTCSDDEDEENEYAVSHNTYTNRGFEFYYDYNRVYPTNSSEQPVEICDVPADCQVENIPEGLEDYDYMSAPLSGGPVQAEDFSQESSESTLKRTTSGNLSGSMGNLAESLSGSMANLAGAGQAPPATRSKTFLFDDDTSGSDEDGEESDDGDDFLISAPPLSRTATADFKISTASSSASPEATTVTETVSGSTPTQISRNGGSYASLSEIASNGYRVKAQQSDVNELNRDFENLHASQDEESSPSRLSQFLGKPWKS